MARNTTPDPNDPGDTQQVRDYVENVVDKYQSKDKVTRVLIAVALVAAVVLLIAKCNGSL